MRKFLVSILIIIFVPVFVFSLFIHAVLNTLLDQNLLKESLRKTGAYEKVLKEGLPDLVDQFPDKSENFLSLVNKKEAENLLVGTIKPEELQDLTENTIDAVITYLNFESKDIELSYDLKQYKSNFSSGFKKIIIGKLNNLPSCTSSQLLDISNKTIPECIPSGQTGQTVYEQLDLDGQLVGMANSLPDELIITKNKILVKPKGSLDINQNESPISGIDTVRENISNLSATRQISFVLLAIIILFIILLRLPRWRSIFSSVGWAFLLGGAIAGILSLVVRLSSNLTGDIAKALKAPENLAPLVGDISKEIIGSFTNQIFLIAVPILIIGAILVVVAFFGKNKSKNKLQFKKK